MENNIACIKETLRSSMCDNEQIIIKKKENPVLDILDKVSKNLLDNINMSEIKQQSDFNSINEYGIYLKELYFSNIKDINGIAKLLEENIKAQKLNISNQIKLQQDLSNIEWEKTKVKNVSIKNLYEIFKTSEFNTDIKKYKFLKNGAMYSILVLGAVMLIDAFGFHLPDYTSPVATFTIIGYFFWLSVRKL